jgi:hypothetical protein
MKTPSRIDGCLLSQVSGTAWIVQQGDDLAGEVGRIPRLMKDAINLIANDLRDASSSGTHEWASHGLGFQSRKSEGFITRTNNRHSGLATKCVER